MATGEDFEKGEPWPDFDGAIIHARESVRQDGRLSWIRCDEKFVLSPPKGIGVPPRGGNGGFYLHRTGSPRFIATFQQSSNKRPHLIYPRSLISG